jgi:serine/threonine protein kinase
LDDFKVGFEGSGPMQRGEIVQLKAVLESKGYTFVKEIGSGGSACCYLVLSQQYHELFVCKVMSLQRRQICPECEINALRQLSCPNVIYLYDVVVAPAAVYIFLEYCPGGSLSDVCQKKGLLQGRQLHGVCKGILNGLVYIHEHRYAHLDLKPGNVLVDRFGRPKLADFGISHQYDTGGNEGKQRAGTSAYMAPEMLLCPTYDPFKADIWALGVMYFAIGYGTYPWCANTHEEMRMARMTGKLTFPKGCDPDFAAAVTAMLDPDPAKRPSAAQCMAMPLFQAADVKDGKIDVGERKSGGESSRVKVAPMKMVMPAACSTKRAGPTKIETARNPTVPAVQPKTH